VTTGIALARLARFKQTVFARGTADQGEQGRVRDRACVAPRAGRNAAPVDGRPPLRRSLNLVAAAQGVW